MTTAQHITIGDLSPRAQYVADGQLAAFSFPFPIFTAQDLEVYLDDVRASDGFTLTGVGATDGGTVTFAVVPPAGTLVTLRRRLAIRRLTDFQEGGAFRAKVVNDELDYQTAVLQQLAVDLARCLRLSPTDPSTANLELPPVAPGKTIGWNDDGTGLTNEPSNFKAVHDAIQASAAAAEAAAARADERAAIAEAVTEPMLLPTVDAQAAAVMAQESEAAAAAAAGAAAQAEAGAEAAIGQVAHDAATAQAAGDDAMTSLWIAEANRLSAMALVEAAQTAESAARTAADAALLDRLDANRAVARVQATVVVGTQPWQVLPNWAAIGGM